MLDRAIGILGIAFAIIFGIWSLAPEAWPKMPAWASLTGIGLGILLVGLALGMIFGGYRKSHSEGAISEDFPTADWGKQLKNVFRVHFKNETVLLDGCDFIECTFDDC